MRALDLDLDHLRLLNEALDYALHPLLERIVLLRGEPQICAIRDRPAASGPSSWRLRVHGLTIEQEFEIRSSNVVALGIVAQVWLADITNDLKADLALALRDASTEHTFDQMLPWPRGPRGSS